MPSIHFISFVDVIKFKEDYVRRILINRVVNILSQIASVLPYKYNSVISKCVNLLKYCFERWLMNLLFFRIILVSLFYIVTWNWLLCYIYECCTTTHQQQKFSLKGFIIVVLQRPLKCILVFACNMEYYRDGRSSENWNWILNYYISHLLDWTSKFME